jgi:hypothetical protein
LIEVFAAIMGRSFSNRADVLIAVMVSTFLFLMLINFIPLLSQSNHFQSFMKVLIVLWISMMISSAYIFPYSKERPKRVTVQHVINYENETTFNSFVALISSDAIPMSFVPGVKNLEEKKLKVYPIPSLGPPSSKATDVFRFVNSTLDKTIPDLLPSLIPKYSVKRDHSNVSVSLQSNVELFSIHVELKSNCSLSSWSLPVDVSESFNGKSFKYQFRHVNAFYDRDLGTKLFNFDFSQKECGKNDTRVFMKFASFFHEESLMSESINNVVQDFPDWTSVSKIMVSVLKTKV